MRPTMPLPRRPLPSMARVRQELPDARIPDVRRETCQRLLDAGIRDRVHSGARIAITAGSRGIGGFVELVSGIVDAVKVAGGEPFVIPAMGSHGGAVPDGQIEILNRLGVTEASVGAPIRATMDTFALGRTVNGAVAHLDRIASESDGVIVLGRVKTHPEKHADLASGLLKMVTIGLGKQVGAQQAHSHGLWDSVRQVPEVTMASGKVLFGVAVVENGYRQPLLIEVVPPDYQAFLEADVRLLKIAREHVAQIPFPELDLLIVDEIGKTISGTSMDLNVIGHWRLEGGPKVPNFQRIAALSLTHGSLGNALGVGLADFVTERLARDYDPRVTYINLLTASEPGGSAQEGPLPIPLPCDRDAAEVALYSAIASDSPRVCRIKNTGALDEMEVSEALLAEVKQNPRLEMLSASAPPAYDADGNFVPFAAFSGAGMHRAAA